MYIGSGIIDVGQSRKNPVVRLGPEFFQGAKKDYTDWKEKWWREVIQNSVDAGATKIICTTENIYLDGREVHRVSCQDNGKGMTPEILLDKFLVLGETTKKTEGGSTGGFGKAKELIILPWIEWEIRTRDLKVVGSGADYDVFKDQPYIDGVKVTAIMGQGYDDHTTDLAAKSFIRKCNIPNVEFVVNGEIIPANFTGELVREEEDFDVYYNEEGGFDKDKVIVRTNGLYTFYTYLLSSKLEGNVIIELKKPSIEILQSNRDGFRDRSVKRSYEKFIGELSKDVRSGVRGGNRIRKIYKQGKKFSTSERENMADELSEELMRKGLETKQKRTTVSEQGIHEIFQEISELSSVPKGVEVLGINNNPSIGVAETRELIEALVRDVDIKSEEEISNMIQQLSWEPDFYVVNEIKEYEVPDQFFPENMGPKIRKLARLWAEFCRFVLIQLGSNKTFGVGFIFSHDYRGYTVAEFVYEDGENWLLINPFKEGNPEKGLLNISDENDIDHMYAAAIHEATHIADGISYHDEDFASAITRNIKKTLRGRKNLRAIKKAISDFYKEAAKKKPKIKKLSKMDWEGKAYFRVRKVGARGRSGNFLSLRDIVSYINSKGVDEESVYEIVPTYWESNVFESKPEEQNFWSFYYKDEMFYISSEANSELIIDDIKHYLGNLKRSYQSYNLNIDPDFYFNYK